MAVELTVPQMGESITEAVVAKWHKQPGEPVAADEPVVALETDKVTVEVPAPAAGALEAIAHPVGDKVKIGDVLGTIAPGAARAAPPEPAKASSLTPVARKMVEERGLDAAQIRGSGPAGRILKEDVLEHLAARQPSPAPAAAPVRPPPPAPPLEARPGAKPREERVKMTPLRKRVAERLLQAQSTAAMLTTFNEADLSAVQRLRKGHGEAFLARHGVKLGLMSFFVRACVEALKSFPPLNAEIEGDEVVFKRYYDLGVAVSGSRGLVVPVLREADQLSMAELERRIADFGARARSDKLTLEELQGGTFTISNGGIFGSMLSTPILNPPQTGILGMHAIQERPVVREGQVVVRPMMYLALTYDHRLVDGREAVQFLVRIKECVEAPERLLLEM